VFWMSESLTDSDENGYIVERRDFRRH
jgi:hypothetical protein